MKITKVTNRTKFLLLLWKNWILEMKHPIRMGFELICPFLFLVFLILLRLTTDHEKISVTTYESTPIDSLAVFQNTIGRNPYDQETTNVTSFQFKDRAKRNALDNLEMTVAYAPTNPILEKIVARAANGLGLKHEGVDSAAALEALLTARNLFAGIEFDAKLADLSSTTGFNKLKFALRFPSQLRTVSNEDKLISWSTKRLFPRNQRIGPRNRNDKDGGTPAGYVREGFLPLQHAISIAYVKEVSGVDQLPNVVLQRYPYPAFIQDQMLEINQMILPIFVCLCFFYTCTVVTKYVTLEKEKVLKEIMRIMGLSNWLHWAAWFVKVFSLFAINMAIVTFILTYKWNEGILASSEWSLLYAFLLDYAIALITFCFMMSTFFGRASTAGAITSFLLFLLMLPGMSISQHYQETSLGAKVGFSLLMNSAIFFGFSEIADFEGRGDGIQWKYLFTASSIDSNFSLGAIMLLMLAASVVQMLVCLYVEQIYPGTLSTPKKWYFPLTSDFWSCKSRQTVTPTKYKPPDISMTEGDAFEMEPKGKPIGIQLRSLKKTFGKKTAVKGISMNMYENEITVLLGHNGAGKTTTISMLIGMCPPTAGTAIINGSDIRSNMEGARMSMGICPQQNVLFDDMSVENHLRFFSRLKGIKSKDVKWEIEKYLRIIELENKAKVAASKLSGGMKRKLSLCCALAGDTKVVLCDEPSSGMDPSARRQLWDLLQAEKAGRTILLTTHFMDEADVLGDRIAIMSEGELKCHGTSFFLKKKFGSGYRLICEKREHCDSARVTELMRKYVPNIQPVSEVGSELTYQLAEEYLPIFKRMLGDLENNTERLQLNGFGIGTASLEDVFMNVGSEKDKDGDDIKSIQIGRTFDESTRFLKGKDLCLSQWKAMFLKKMLISRRKWKIYAIIIIVPIILMCLELNSHVGKFENLPRMTMSLKQYPKLAIILAKDENVVKGSVEDRISDQYKSFAKSFGRERTFQSIGGQSFSDYILELGKEIQVRINQRYLCAATIASGQITTWFNNQPLHTAPLAVNLVHNAMAKALIDPKAEIVVTNAPLPFTSDVRIKQALKSSALVTALILQMAFFTPLFVFFVIPECVSRAKLLQFIAGVRVWIFWLTHWLWDFALLTVSSILVVITVACFQPSGFSTFEELGRLFLVMLVFSFAVLPLMYVFSFLFTEAITGFSRILLINCLVHVLFVIAFLMETAGQSIGKLLNRIGRIFPLFSLGIAVQKLRYNSQIREICSTLPMSVRCMYQCCPPSSYFTGQKGILTELSTMMFIGILCFLILMLLDAQYSEKYLTRFCRKLKRKPPPLPTEENAVDDDVQRERERISAMPREEIVKQNLVLDRVSKFYKKFLAVNQISLCVGSGECFGLMGVNGAGKTTTFKMMIGDVKISKGTAYIKGKNVSAEIATIYTDIGYCPQCDALLEDLTGREILKIFSMVRGVRSKNIQFYTFQMATIFGLTTQIDKPTKAYSGGSKRKLSAAIAVLGNPSVIFMDEPTTGIDPAARRRLWNIVSAVRDAGKSIILTTHSMEECEALCTRLAIMVNGEFKCIGSSQHLKNKFSKGLILKIKVKRNIVSYDEEFIAEMKHLEDLLKIFEFFVRKFPAATLQKEYNGILTFYIPSSNITWSEIFGIMEENRSLINIEDYSISQTTLEEIFLDFALLQYEDTRQIK